MTWGYCDPCFMGKRCQDCIDPHGKAYKCACFMFNEIHRWKHGLPVCPEDDERVGADGLGSSPVTNRWAQEAEQQRDFFTERG